MRSVYVLGNGQLGQMLRQAGEPLAINVIPIGSDYIPENSNWRHSVITAEIEQWPDTPFIHYLAKQDNFINRDIFTLLADRLTQKRLLDELALPTAAWQPLSSYNQWPSLFDSLAEQLIVKLRKGGYDGRGQWSVHPHNVQDIPEKCYGNAIVEQIIPFIAELSLIGARNIAGKCVFYPVTYNLHEQGILRASIASHKIDPLLQAQAEHMLTLIMDKLHYVGVMAMECFVTTDNTLLINELAPRVHNSGHWTQDGASISQFELHLRAIIDLPLLKPKINSLSVMINLIGCPLDYRWLSVDEVYLHWYGKEIRPRRKLGHLNLLSQETRSLIASLDQLKEFLSNDFVSCINWSQQWLMNLLKK